ncbi:hypothetical protein SNEBB_003408 [Seison nebaliae]|nr:hypothetical protein SNEBB_003408 [Seison nebaliae]
MGKEGREAARRSDYCFAQFRSIERTLLVHGQQFYWRLSYIILYFFYKNVVFIMPQILFGFHSAFSTQPLYTSLLLTLYNIFFCSLPILIYGIFEQQTTSNRLISSPIFYSYHVRNQLLLILNFARWNFLGMWHGAISFYIPYFMMNMSESTRNDGKQMDIYGFGIIIMTNVVLIVNFKLLLEARYWNLFFLLSFSGSFMAILVFYTFLSYISFMQEEDLQDLSLLVFGQPTTYVIIVQSLLIALIPDIICICIEDLVISRLVTKNRKGRQLHTTQQSVSIASEYGESGLISDSAKSN